MQTVKTFLQDRRSKVIVLLSAETVVCGPDDKLYVNPDAKTFSSNSPPKQPYILLKYKSGWLDAALDAIQSMRICSVAKVPDGFVLIDNLSLYGSLLPTIPASLTYQA